MKIVARSTQPNLAKRIGELLNTDLVQSRVEKFKDGKLRVQIIDKLENEDVAIIQSTSNPVNDNLMELLLLISLFIPLINMLENPVIVSLDARSVLQAKAISESLKCDFALIDKRRVGRGEYNIMDKLEGNVENRHCVLIDGIIDTGGTICKAANLLKERGALSIKTFVTHNEFNSVYLILSKFA